MPLSHPEDALEIRGLLQSVLREVEGVNKRLDKVNGRLDRHEDAIADAYKEAAGIKANVIGLNREVFERVRGEPSTAALVKELQTLVQSATSGDNRPAFTVGDVNLVTKVGRLAWAVMGLLGGAGLVFWAQRVIK